MKGLFNNFVTVKRLSSYVGGKADYSIVSSDVEGHFEPIDATPSTLALRITGQAYRFTTEAHNSIRANDRLIVDGVEYGVKGVSTFTQKGIRFLKCIIEQPSI